MMPWCVVEGRMVHHAGHTGDRTGTLLKIHWDSFWRLGFITLVSKFQFSFHAMRAFTFFMAKEFYHTGKEMCEFSTCITIND